MKKILFVSAMMLMVVFLFEGCVTTTTPVSASSSMTVSKIRNHARFLTDRMAYELDFTPMQYEDCYEINYDFIYYVSSFMPDVVHGYYDAINSYYRYLDYRNDDLRFIMTASQYIRFMSKPYFYRPIYTSGSSWNFRVYTIYSNRSFYYYDAPIIYKKYNGGHSRTYYTNSYYVNRYNSRDRFTGDPRIMGSHSFNDHRRNDFGSNLRERNQKPDYNNYGNRNSSNRTADPRYRDSSGNHNSPLINSRSSNTGEQRGQNTEASRGERTNSGRGQGTTRQSTSTSTSTRQSGNTSSTRQSGNTTNTRQSTGTSTRGRSETTTQTGTRSGNDTPTTTSRGESRGNRSTTTRR